MIDYNTSPLRGMNAGRLPFLSRLRGLIGVDATRASIPPAERAIGCDVSHWDGLVNYHAMQLAGARFVYLKATQAISILDNQYNTSRNNVAGILPFGSYHFLTTSPGDAQANWFCDHASANPGALPPGWTTYSVHQYSGDGNGLGHTYGGQSSSMDLNRCRKSWLAQYEPVHDSWSWDVTTGLRALGQTVRDPE